MAGNNWAIVLCHASDLPPGPNSRERWVEFFTATNADPSGAFAYWRDISYGIANMTGSQVLGWFDLGHSRVELENAIGTAARQQTFDWGFQATAGLVDLTAFAHKIIVVNVSTDHGKTGGGVLFGYEDNRPLEPTFMAHEMGHEMGLGHSYGENPTPCASGDSQPGAYCDRWDVMSAMNVASYQDAQNRQSGPGLNAPNLQRLGVVDRSRIWSPPGGWFIYGGITLAAINRPDVDGYLMVTFPGPSRDLKQGDLSTYFIEFRQRTKWDTGLPTDAVLIHEVRGSDGLSRLLTNWNSGQLQVGQPFSPPGSGVVVQVNSINPAASQATLSLSGAVPSKIMARSSRKVLDVTGGPTATGNGVHIQQWSDLGATNQQWLFLPMGSGIYRIMSRSSGKVLDVTGGPTATGNGIPIQQWSDLGATNQQWELVLTGDGTYFKIVSQSSGKVLDVRGGPSAGADGVLIQQWQDRDTTNQQWYLIPVGGIYKIVSRSSGKVLDVRGGPGAIDDGVPVQQYSDLGGTNQRWLLVDTDSGFFQIVAESSGKALDVTGGPTATGNGTPIQQWTYNGTTNQQWQIEAVDRGYYKIVSRSSGKSLDVRGGPGATDDGVPVQQWTYNGTTNQQWQLMPIDSMGTNSTANLLANGAAAFRWGSYIDTDLDLANFYSSDHTLMLRFMAQYERAYEGPLVANTGAGTYYVEIGDYGAAGGKANLFVNINGATARYLIPNPARYPADYPDYWDTIRNCPTSSTVPPLPILPWRHLALVKQGNSLALWLDGQHILPDGSATDLVLPASTPTGQLRLGKRIINPTERETQFYGFIDDLALFDYAMTYSDIIMVYPQMTLTGNERGLRAGLVFQDLPSGTPAALQQSYTLKGSAYIQEISATKNTVADNNKLPIPIQRATYHLPFKHGEIWQVMQAFNSYGTHNSYAAFCWDFILVPPSAPIGQPQINAAPTDGRVFVAAADGTVVEIVPGSGSPALPASNLLIQSGPNEYHGYMHFPSSSLMVSVNANVSTGDDLARASNVGGGGPHLHFGVADHPESQHDQLVTFPIYFSDYHASNDYGKTWYNVPWGMPRVGQWVRS